MVGSYTAAVVAGRVIQTPALQSVSANSSVMEIIIESYVLTAAALMHCAVQIMSRLFYV